VCLMMSPAAEVESSEIDPVVPCVDETTADDWSRASRAVISPHHLGMPPRASGHTTLVRVSDLPSSLAHMYQGQIMLELEDWITTSVGQGQSAAATIL
jgi:hypothetical protein